MVRRILGYTGSMNGVGPIRVQRIRYSLRINKLKAIGDFLDRQKSWAPLLLRLAIGATFVVHGYGKVFGGGLPETAARLAGGFGLPALFGYLVAFGEFFGGVGLIAGFLTRFCTGSIGLIMLGAIYSHAVARGQPFRMGAAIVEGQARGTGWEWQAALLAGCLTLVILGGGCLAVDAWIRLRMGGTK